MTGKTYVFSFSRSADYTSRLVYKVSNVYTKRMRFQSPFISHLAEWFCFYLCVLVVK